MILDFAGALRDLGGQDAVVRIANAAKPAADYLFATFLPERNRPSYVAKAGTISIRSTMAGVVGMDSPYPPTGLAESSTFLEQVAKIANNVTIPEKLMRELQEMAQQLQLSGAPTNQFALDALLNFVAKCVLQPHLDRMEWLRGQALVTGELAWEFNDIEIAVDYQVPTGNFLTARTGNDKYGGSASKWWTDLAAARKLLKQRLRAIVMHDDTLDAIVTNSVNNIEVLSQTGAAFTIRRLIANSSGDAFRPSSDARETVQLVAYHGEGEVYDQANTGQTKKVPFMPTGKVLFVGQNQRDEFQVGQGGTTDPENDLELGYTHIGPTVEGGGLAGRWARVYVPEGRPWQVAGEAVTNGLPVIEAPDKIVVGTTDL